MKIRITPERRMIDNGTRREVGVRIALTMEGTTKDDPEAIAPPGQRAPTTQKDRRGNPSVVLRKIFGNSPQKIGGGLYATKTKTR